MTSSSFKAKGDLLFKPGLLRNQGNRLMTGIAAAFSVIAIIPLIAVILFVLIKGFAFLRPAMFFELPPVPGQEMGGGIGNAFLGTFIVTGLSCLFAIPVGVGGGIYLAEYGGENKFSEFIRFGTNVLAGVPSIIAGVFIYGLIVSSRILFGSTFSAVAGGLALSVLMLPTIIKTTDEGLKLVPQELRWGALGVGASKFVTTIKVVVPSAIAPIATGVVLGIARSAGETAPLIFTAFFSPYWPDGLLEPMATMSVMIFNYAIMPYEAQVQLAWAASFVLVIMILAMNLLARWLSSFAQR
ncbi:ABC-type phosphate transport system permease component [Synechococcus sp. Minos11]|uniref:phosphate ABC transporter permease PstA n=1 Tax=Synechococcus sp. Minos11 TaxID=221341 RepID=UPI001647527D|nr:phosphate ABC transporter permease PstA [Synechococcus sp. Minos11]QNJ08935.1 ABC-type phosphate transport system permease component [Synechococcus sp. Minos11]